MSYHVDTEDVDRFFAPSGDFQAADQDANSGEETSAGLVVRKTDVPGVGMGAAVARILRKPVPGDPVLALRKTQLMRELDTDKETQQKQKRRRLDWENKQQIGTRMLLGREEILREKIMRKTATRAIVVLLNAISKRRHLRLTESADAEGNTRKRRPAVRRYDKEVEITDAGRAKALGNDWINSDFCLDAGTAKREEEVQSNANKQGGSLLHAFLHHNSHVDQMDTI